MRLVNWVWMPSHDCSSATALSVEAAVDGGVTGAATWAGAGVAGAAAVLPFPEPFPEPLPDDLAAVVFPLPEPLALVVDLVDEVRDFFAGVAGAEAVDLVDDDFLAGMFFDNYT